VCACRLRCTGRASAKTRASGRSGVPGGHNATPCNMPSAGRWQRSASRCRAPSALQRFLIAHASCERARVRVCKSVRVRYFVRCYARLRVVAVVCDDGCVPCVYAGLFVSLSVHECVRMCLRACTCVHAHVRACACMRAHVACACVCARACVRVPARARACSFLLARGVGVNVATRDAPHSAPLHMASMRCAERGPWQPYRALCVARGSRSGHRAG
jgi:hypothetical protein